MCMHTQPQLLQLYIDNRAIYNTQIHKHSSMQFFWNSTDWNIWRFDDQIFVDVWRCINSRSIFNWLEMRRKFCWLLLNRTKINAWSNAPIRLKYFDMQYEIVTITSESLFKYILQLRLMGRFMFYFY